MTFIGDEVCKTWACPYTLRDIVDRKNGFDLILPEQVHLVSGPKVSNDDTRDDFRYGWLIHSETTSEWDLSCECPARDQRALSIAKTMARMVLRSGEHLENPRSDGVEVK